jgi:hypothetical protein
MKCIVSTVQHRHSQETQGRQKQAFKNNNWHSSERDSETSKSFPVATSFCLEEASL